MRYLSVCSGIEAASVAWHPLGWQPVAFSEIDPFASAVLEARFPGVPNLGNMENYREWNVPAFDILVGGTPCQSFSVAGLRKGLDDPRGNLALVYLGLVDRFRPRWCVWENVPGVLSSSGGRDFGSFLGGLAQLGYGFAYRVLDAQYVRVESHPHAVPQRRRRVFVVGCAGGDWRSAAEVLLEPEGMRGDSAPRREARKGAPRGVADGARGGGVAGTVAAKWRKGTGGPAGDEFHNLVEGPLPFDTTQVTHPANRSVPRPGDPCHPLARVRHAPAVALGFEPRYYLRDNKTGGAPADTVALTASASKVGDSAPHVAFAIQERAVCENPAAGPDGIGVREGVSYTLESRTVPQAVATAAFSWPVEVADPITANEGGTYTHEGSRNFRMHNVVPATIGFSTSSLDSPREGTSPPLKASMNGQGTGAGPSAFVAIEAAPTLTATNDPSRSPQSSEVTQQVAAVHAATMAVRRLTPRECERLQGFPDDWTAITYRGKPAADGPRYKALGNSMAVNVMRFIGERMR